LATPTNAGLQDRIKVLDLLIRKDAEASFDVLEGLLSRGPQMATPAARPKWREDDAGAGQRVTNHEMSEMLAAAKERVLELSKGNALRIASLIQNTQLRNRKEMTRILALMQPFTMTAARDEDREVLCAALRTIVHWHRNYDDQTRSTELDQWLNQVMDYYVRLAPLDRVTRHRWLFCRH
jgi:hypothetical protein